MHVSFFYYLSKNHYAVNCHYESTRYNDVQGEFFHNVSSHLQGLPLVVYEQDCFSLDLNGISEKVTFYFYDIHLQLPRAFALGMPQTAIFVKFLRLAQVFPHLEKLGASGFQPSKEEAAKFEQLAYKQFRNLRGIKFSTGFEI